MITRRRFVAASLALAGAAPLARAQVLQRPSRILVGYPPGGSIDTAARVMAEKMRGTYAPTVIVENRPGSRQSGVMQGLMSSPADGSTMLIAPHSINIVWPHVYKTLSFDPLKDLIPVSQVHLADFAFAVGAGVPVQTLAQYATWVKENPKKNGLYGITGALGGTPHFLGLLYAQSAGLDLTPVPYKGTVQGVQDLIGGQTPGWMGPLSDIDRFHAAGKARILATTGPARSKFVPQIPTFTELGHPAATWQERFGIYLRAGASAATVQMLNKAVREVLDMPDVKALFEKYTTEARSSTPEEFEAIIRRENERWGKIIKASGFQPED